MRRSKETCRIVSSCIAKHMNFLFEWLAELFAEIVVDASCQGAKNKQLPRWLRRIAAGIVFLIVILITVIILAMAILGIVLWKDGEYGKSLLFFLITALLLRTEIAKGKTLYRTYFAQKRKNSVK